MWEVMYQISKQKIDASAYLICKNSTDAETIREVQHTLNTIFDVVKSSGYQRDCLFQLDLSSLYSPNKSVDHMSHSSYDIVPMLVGFNAMLRGDFRYSHKIIEAIDDIDEVKDLAHDVLDLSQRMEDPKRFESIYKNLSSSLNIDEQSENLFSTSVNYADDQDENKKNTLVKYTSTTSNTKERQSPAHMFILGQLIQALDGKTQSFGFIYDILNTQGRSYIATLLGFISDPNTKSYLFSNKNHVQENIKIMFSQILESMSVPEKHMKEYFKREIHLLTFALMKPYSKVFDQLLGLNQFGQVFKNPKLFETLKGVAQKQDVDLSSVLEISGLKNSEAKIIKNFTSVDGLNTLREIEDEFGYFEPQNTEEHEEGEPDIKIHCKETITQNFEYEIIEEGVKVPISNLFRILFRVMNGDKESFLELIKIISPCYKNFHGYERMLTTLYSVVEGTQQNMQDQTIENLLALLIYSAYAEKQVKDPEYIDVLRAKYNHSLDNISSINQFFSNLVKIINRKHAEETLADTRYTILSLCEWIETIWNNWNEGNLIFSDDMVERRNDTKIAKKTKSKMIIDSVSKNVTTDIQLYMIGLIKKDFSYIEAIACRYGFFEKDLVKELFTIFENHKHVLFLNGVKELPEVCEKVKF